MTDASDPRRALEEAVLDSARRGDRDTVAELAVELLRHDPGNAVARRVLAEHDIDLPGELRRITILFCDLVGSTSMSARQAPDTYGRVLRRYHRLCETVISAHGGTVNRRVGDGVLAVFGHPRSHEDDTRRAVRAALALTKGVDAIRADVQRELGESLQIRIAIHLGPVHLDPLDSEIYGLAPNLAARLQDLAAPGTVVVSDEVLELVGGFFVTRAHDAEPVKGVDAPVVFHTVDRELPQTPERGRTWHTPFVGRREALARLRAAVDDGTPAVIRGEAGIGKSRLVAEVLRDPTSTTPPVTTVVCSEYEQTSDLGAARGLLRLAPSAASDQGPSERLQQLVDDLGALGLDPDEHTGLLAPLLGLDPSLGYARPAADLTRVHDRVLASLRAWLTARAGRQSLIVLVEDVHWADGSTIELLVGLVREPIEGVQLIATERTGTERLRGPDLAVIDLTPLSFEESAELARAVDVDIDGHRLATTLGRGQGNPLFVEELAREPDAPSVVDPELLTRLTTESAVPAALYEPLLARLHSSGADVGLAQAAATIGRSFSGEVLESVVSRQPDLLERGMRSLLDAGLVDAAGDGVYWFRHALIRDVAYDLQPSEQRAAVHGRVGDALRTRREKGADVPWSIIATHFHAAGRIDDAIDGYASAADESRERGSMSVGVEHLTSAIDLLAARAGLDGTQQLREVDLRLKRGFLCVSTGGNADPRAVADYERCLELVRAEENGPELVGTLVALWGFHTARGDLAEADGLLDDIVATGITDDPVRLAENRTARGTVRFFQGDFVASEEHLRLAIDGMPGADDDARPLSPWQFPNDPVVFMHVQFGLASWQRGDLAAFDAQVRQARRRAERLPRPHGPFNVAYALTYHAWVLTEVGDFDAAAARTAELLDEAERYGFDFWTLAGTTNDAILTARRSLASGALDNPLLLEQAGRLGGTSTMTQMIDSKLLLSYSLTAQADFVASAGDHDQALALFDQAMDVADTTGSQFYRAETHRLRARSRAALGDDAADDDLHEAIELAGRQGSIPFELRARLDLAQRGQRTARLEELCADPRFVEASGVDRQRLTSSIT